MTTPTQKPLKDMISDILVHINRKFESNITYAREQLDIYDGDVKTYVERSIRNEVASPKALAILTERIIPINILKQTVDKLSNAYDGNISREASEEVDQEWLDYYSNQMCIDTRMNFSNKMFNLHKYCGLEPFLDYDGTPKLRILDASRYIPYSDDPRDPNRPTVAIKWISNIHKEIPAIDSQGRKMANAKAVIREVKLYYVYSSTEFIVMDGDGVIQSDMMKQLGNPEGKHSIGMLPIIHISASDYDLVPLQDTSKRDITISVSKKLTDLSYATLFQSHSMIYAIDCEVSALDSNPDAFLSIKSDDSDGVSPKSPQIGMLQPKVNIPENLQLINAEVSMHLKSLGLNPGQAEQGANNAASVASGVSKMIDEAGAEQVKREQRVIFKKAEENGLWKLLVKLHNLWLAENLVAFKKGVSEKLKVSVSYEDRKPSESETSVIERISKKLEAGLTSRKRALSEANPDLDSDQIEELIKEIDEEQGLNIDISGLVPKQNQEVIDNSTDNQEEK